MGEAGFFSFYIGDPIPDVLPPQANRITSAKACPQ